MSPSCLRPSRPRTCFCPAVPADRAGPPPPPPPPPPRPPPRPRSAARRGSSGTDRPPPRPLSARGGWGLTGSRTGRGCPGAAAARRPGLPARATRQPRRVPAHSRRSARPPEAALRGQLPTASGPGRGASCVRDPPPAPPGEGPGSLRERLPFLFPPRPATRWRCAPASARSARGASPAGSVPRAPGAAQLRAWKSPPGRAGPAGGRGWGAPGSRLEPPRRARVFRGRPGPSPDPDPDPEGPHARVSPPGAQAGAGPASYSQTPTGRLALKTPVNGVKSELSQSVSSTYRSSQTYNV